MYENKINLIFIGILNFLGFKLTSMHVLFHSYLNLPNFFGQPMHFVNFLAKLYKNIYEVPLKFFISRNILASLGEKMPKTCPLKGFLKAQSSTFTIYLKTLVIVFKFEPSFFTYVIIFFLNSYACKISMKFLPMFIM